MQTIVDRPATAREPVELTTSAVERARVKLDRALAQRDRAREHYEAAIGTSGEFGAYVHLRAASHEVSAADKWLRWAEGEFVFPPPRDDAMMEELVGGFE